MPEAAVHAFLTALFLINGYWIALILNLPLLAYNAKKCVLEGSALARSYLTFVAGSLRISICWTRQRSSGNLMCIKGYGSSHACGDNSSCANSRGVTDFVPGIFRQARLPSDYVLLLPVQHDRRSDKGRVPLTTRQSTQEHEGGRCLLMAIHMNAEACVAVVACPRISPYEVRGKNGTSQRLYRTGISRLLRLVEFYNLKLLRIPSVFS